MSDQPEPSRDLVDVLDRVLVADRARQVELGNKGLVRVLDGILRDRIASRQAKNAGARSR